MGSFGCFLVFLLVHMQQTNMESENEPLEEEVSFEHHHSPLYIQFREFVMIVLKKGLHAHWRN